MSDCMRIVKQYLGSTSLQVRYPTVGPATASTKGSSLRNLLNLVFPTPAGFSTCTRSSIGETNTIRINTNGEVLLIYVFPRRCRSLLKSARNCWEISHCA